MQSRVCEPAADSLTSFELAKETNIAQVPKHGPGLSRELGAGWVQHST